MSGDPRVEAVASALRDTVCSCEHREDELAFLGCADCDAEVAVAALDAYDRERAPASRDAKWISFHKSDLRDHIARDILAAAALIREHRDADDYRNAYLDGLTLAARIARGAS